MKKISSIFMLLLANLASDFLPWINAVKGSKTYLFRLTNFNWVEISSMFLISIALTTLLLSRYSSNNDFWEKLSVVPIGLLFTGSIIVLVCTDILGSFIPHIFLPGQLRSFFVVVSAGPGAWAASITSGVALYLSVVKSLPIDNLGAAYKQLISWFNSAPDRLLMVLCVLGIFIARFSSFLSISIEGTNTNLQSWLLPWVGGYSLEALILLVVALMLHYFYPTLSDLLSIVVCWLVFIGCVLVHSLSDKVAHITQVRLNGYSVSSMNSTVSFGFWLFFVSSFLGVTSSIWSLQRLSVQPISTELLRSNQKD